MAIHALLTSCDKLSLPSVLRVVFSTLFSVFGYPDETLSLVLDILRHQLLISKTKEPLNVLSSSVDAGVLDMDTSPNTITPKMAKNHEISVYFRQTRS